ncbi:MAG TPA: hypothetical protein VEL82_06325 [Thermoplasmata archaeon]|nr:hypothetical protein [Thermoplasmata archaeon]
MNGAGRGAEATGEGPRAEPALRPETALLLAGLALILVFLALEPFLSYALFGSDTGEYYGLTAALVASGHVPTGAAYGGWGTAYPDFPGIFVLSGAGSGALGLSPFTALTTIVPVVAVLSVLPLFLLFRRLYPHDGVALLAAAVASLAMPRLFSIAHPAPLALGDFLAVAAMWIFLETRRDVRWYLPLALVSGALIVTHHLSTYFFAVGALGGLVLLELWRPALWSRRFPTREFVYLGALATATFAFWCFGTVEFVAKVIDPIFPHPPAVAVVFALLEAGALSALVLLGLLLRWRRARFRPTRAWVRRPSDPSVLRDALLIAVGVFGGIAALLVVPIPGTTQTTSAAAILWFSPLLALVVFTTGTRRATRTARLGPLGLTWLGTIALSAIATLGAGVVFGTAGSSLAAAIPPSRHAEYLFLPLGLLIAVGAARLLARLGDRAGRRAFVAGAIGLVAILGANAAIVYPPQSDLGGFEEGLTHADAGIWSWIGIAEPPTSVVASDHRLSSMIFGFDGNPATWDSTPALFTGSNWSNARAELLSSGAPYVHHPIDLVAVDSVMYGGVALDPSSAALPLSAAAIAWLGGMPFVPLYESGANDVYLVDASALSA